MISNADILEVNVSAEDVEFCKNNPAPGCTRKSTGELKALGNMVLRRVFKSTPEELAAHTQIITDSGVACVKELADKRLVGITAAVSVIHDDNVLKKRLIVAANQLYKHQLLDSHYTVGVLVHGQTNEQGEIVSVEKVYVTGWVPTLKLKRWVKKGGDGPFVVHQASLAIAPSEILIPMSRLQSTVCWEQFEV